VKLEKNGLKTGVERRKHLKAEVVLRDSGSDGHCYQIFSANQKRSQFSLHLRTNICVWEMISIGRQ
jgi:hypothetical protein